MLHAISCFLAFGGNSNVASVPPWCGQASWLHLEHNVIILVDK